MSQSNVKQEKESNVLKVTKQSNQSFKSAEAIKCGFKGEHAASLEAACLQILNGSGNENTNIDNNGTIKICSKSSKKFNIESPMQQLGEKRRRTRSNSVGDLNCEPSLKISNNNNTPKNMKFLTRYRIKVNDTAFSKDTKNGTSTNKKKTNDGTNTSKNTIENIKNTQIGVMSNQVDNVKTKLDKKNNSFNKSRTSESKNTIEFIKKTKIDVMSNQKQKMVKKISLTESKDTRDTNDMLKKYSKSPPSFWKPEWLQKTKMMRRIRYPTKEENEEDQRLIKEKAHKKLEQDLAKKLILQRWLDSQLGSFNSNYEPKKDFQSDSRFDLNDLVKSKTFQKLQNKLKNRFKITIPQIELSIIQQCYLIDILQEDEDKQAQQIEKENEQIVLTKK